MVAGVLPLGHSTDNFGTGRGSQALIPAMDQALLQDAFVSGGSGGIYRAYKARWVQLLVFAGFAVSNVSPPAEGRLQRWRRSCTRECEGIDLECV